MSGAPLIIPWEFASAEEKLRRLKVSYANDRMTLEEFEKQVAKVLREEERLSLNG